MSPVSPSSVQMKKLDLSRKPKVVVDTEGVSEPATPWSGRGLSGRCPPRWLSSARGEVQGNIFVHKAIQIRVINWWQVFEVYYLKHIYLVFAAILLYMLPKDFNYTAIIPWDYLHLEGVYGAVNDIGYVRLFVGTALVMMFYQFFFSKSTVYCLDFECAAPPEEWQVTKKDVMTIMSKQPSLEDKSKEFTERILTTSGIGDQTYWPPCITRCLDEADTRPWTGELKNARAEMEALIFPTIERLLKKTGYKAKEVDFLVVNCSLFCPTPSLCAMICNHFKMRADIASYNLGGMGCSAGVISIDLAKQLLQNRPGAIALVVSTENLSQNLYTGNDRSMMLQNTLFRCGGVAALLSSRSKGKGCYAKYKLVHSGRTFMTDDESYNCVIQEEEEETGRRGVKLDKNIVTVAGKAMTKQFTQLGPVVLPITEQIKTLSSMAMDWLCKNYLNYLAPSTFPARWKIYTPDFKKCIDHFCIHAGGRAVIEGVKKNLKLSDEDVEPSFETLKRWGNTSSSSIWYELQYIEQQKGRIKPGHQVLQIAFGSGFKCNAAVWLRL